MQGVGYRHWAARRAAEQGLAGWVRNRADGSVELMIAGPAAALDRMAALCARGPARAEVDAVTCAPADPPPGRSFARLPTE